LKDAMWSLSKKFSSSVYFITLYSTLWRG
jgi:hypothetical protein